MPDADLMDDVVFTLPIMKELGDQVQITAKTIACLWASLQSAIFSCARSCRRNHQEVPVWWTYSTRVLALYNNPVDSDAQLHITDLFLCFFILYAIRLYYTI